jgi:hypothetical protein
MAFELFQGKTDETNCRHEAIRASQRVVVVLLLSFWRLSEPWINNTPGLFTWVGTGWVTVLLANCSDFLGTILIVLYYPNPNPKSQPVISC